MWNIPFNGLSVALDASTKEIMEDSDSVVLAETLIREVHGAAVAARSSGAGGLDSETA